MTREQQAISANFDLLLISLGAVATKPSQQARSNAGSEFKPAPNSFRQHEEAFETSLLEQSGCFNE